MTQWVWQARKAIAARASRRQRLCVKPELAAKPRDPGPRAPVAALARVVVLQAAQLALDLLAVLAPGGRLAWAGTTETLVGVIDPTPVCQLSDAALRARSTPRLAQEPTSSGGPDVSHANAESRSARVAVMASCTDRVRRSEHRQLREVPPDQGDGALQARLRKREELAGDQRAT